MNEKDRVLEERKVTISILNTLKSLSVFETAKDLGIPHNRGSSHDHDNCLIYPNDLIVKGTNQFIYFDKQHKDGKPGAHKLSEKHRILYVGTFDRDTGKILDWGQ